MPPASPPDAARGSALRHGRRVARSGARLIVAPPTVCGTVCGVGGYSHFGLGASIPPSARTPAAAALRGCGAIPGGPGV